jgi:excisionase family DNA binding protein
MGAGADPDGLGLEQHGCHLAGSSWHAQLLPGEDGAERMDVDRFKPSELIIHRHPFGSRNDVRESAGDLPAPEAWVQDVETIAAEHYFNRLDRLSRRSRQRVYTFHMASTTGNPYLTVAEVAATLGISTDGVYKLIKRGKLPALRLSERGVRVTRWALEAYRESLNGGGPDTRLPDDTFAPEALSSAFEEQTGMSPDDWAAAWKSDRIADSAENNALLVQALALRERRENASQDWIIRTIAQHDAPTPTRIDFAFVGAINGYLQGRLRDLGRHEVPAVEAACWLDDAGLLNDSGARPGLPLRNLLREGQIVGADQRPARRHGRWFITRA